VLDQEPHLIREARPRFHQSTQREQVQPGTCSRCVLELQEGQ
jgi:hypothetical protein